MVSLTPVPVFFFNVKQDEGSAQRTFATRKWQIKGKKTYRVIYSWINRCPLIELNCISVSLSLSLSQARGYTSVGPTQFAKMLPSVLASLGLKLPKSSTSPSSVAFVPDSKTPSKRQRRSRPSQFEWIV